MTNFIPHIIWNVNKIQKFSIIKSKKLVHPKLLNLVDSILCITYGVEEKTNEHVLPSLISNDPRDTLTERLKPDATLTLLSTLKNWQCLKQRQFIRDVELLDPF